MQKAAGFPAAQPVEKPAPAIKPEQVFCLETKAETEKASKQQLQFSAIRRRMAAIPFPNGQLFQIHGSKFKLHPVCHLGQASVLRVTHPVFFLRIGKHTLNLLFSQPVQFFVHRHMPDMLCHLHIVLPDMAQDCFLALGVLGAHPSGGTALAKIASAFVFPVALPVCGGIPGLWWNNAAHGIPDRSHRQSIRHTHRPTRGGRFLWSWGGYSRWKERGRCRRFSCRSRGVCRRCPPPRFCARGNTGILHRTEDQRLHCRGYCRE